MKQYIDLHLHALDQFDSQNDPEEVCRRMKELGADGFALTQHGVLAGIEPMRAACEKYGLKFIPGIETYYGNDDDILQNQHLLLLSADITGYKALCMAVTDAQNTEGFSVMNDEILRRYFAPGALGHGHVIATSACIQGPLAAVIRQNEAVDNRVAKLDRRYKSPADMSERLEAANDRLSQINAEVEDTKAKRDAAKKTAETKFTAREKKLAQLQAKNDPSYEEELAKLNADKEAAKNAAAEFETLKAEVTKLLKKQTVTKQEVKELSESQARYEEYSRLKEEILAKKLSDEEINAGLEAEAIKFREIFGEDNFYVEVQYHGIPLEKEVYQRLAELANRLHIPLVATNDVHITAPTEDERLRRQILRSMRFGTEWEEEGEGDAELYIKTDEELTEWLGKILSEGDVWEATTNTRAIFDRCNVEFPKGEKHYPKFPSRDGKTANEMLEEEIERGIRWRFPNGMDEAHEKRLAHEISVIEKMGYADYHLIVKDFLEYGRVLSAFPADMLDEAPLTIEEAKSWADQNGWKYGLSIGPGRGSAVGSLVCYLLGITSMDPLQYSLLFERFLNPERVSMPDIDCDIAKQIRPKVIQYVQHKYGENAVCGIMTTNAQAPRGAIRIAAKFYGLKTAGDSSSFLNLGDQMAKQVPKDPGTSFSSEDENGRSVYDALCETYAANGDALEILRWAKVIEGSFTAYGAHAAGIVISDNHEVKEYVPLRWNKKLNEWTTQCDMIVTEDKGLLKMDFLGLKTLDVINGCIKAVAERTGKTIDPMEIPMDDAEVFSEIFAKGNTNSVFQFESSGMKSMLKRFKPDKFDDLILLVAAYRPGPLQYLDGVIDAKTGKTPITYQTPELEDILDVTYGYPIYQEQVMAIFQKLAGYTLGGADLVRRFMSKKKFDKLVHEREAFINGDEDRKIDGCVKRGISEEVANSLFDQMTEFAKYAFNKSHAAAYALISYWTAWFKCHYPAEFLMEAMNWSETDDEVKGLMRETRLFDVPVLPPDVNRSESRFSVENGKILYGLGQIKSVGETGNSIINERRSGGPFTSLRDFFLRTGVRKDACENLIKAGALDIFCRNRQAMLAVIEQYKTQVKKYKDKTSFVQDAELLMSRLSEIETKEDLDRVQKELGIAVTDKLTTDKKLQARIDTAKQAAQDAWNDMNIVLAVNTAEDIHQKLEEEREMLGAYVTGHPLDAYDISDTGATEIEDADLTTQTIFGIISELRLTTRKSDGKPMAFLTIEDKTGSMEVCVFTKAYVRCAKCLKEGNAVIVNGRTAEDTDDRVEDSEARKLKMYAETMKKVEPARKVTITVSSYALFHVTEEDEFRKKYEQEDGMKCVIHDSILGEDRLLKYRVSEDALNLPNAKETA